MDRDFNVVNTRVNEVGGASNLGSVSSVIRYLANSTHTFYTSREESVLETPIFVSVAERRRGSFKILLVPVDTF